jgi:hypothetical protein
LKPFVQSDAWAIQKKLGAEVHESTRHHILIRFWHKGVIATQFGIRRGSGELGHGHIPKDMKISQKECREFRKCNISLEEYVNILQDKGYIAKPVQTKTLVTTENPEAESPTKPADSN